MFGRKKKAVLDWDRENSYPVFLASICTGETAAGFRDKATKHFTEVMLIHGEADEKEFLLRYGLSASEVKHEW